MPPLAVTQSKYAVATLPSVVKSTPGISMSIPPSLIGAPVAFFPLPRPHLPGLMIDAEAACAVGRAPALAVIASVARTAEGRPIAMSALRNDIRSSLSFSPLRASGWCYRCVRTSGTRLRISDDEQSFVFGVGNARDSGAEGRTLRDGDVEQEGRRTVGARRNDLVQGGQELVVGDDAAGLAAEAARDRRA